MNIIELAEKAGMTRRPADRQCRAPYWDVVIDPELEHFAAMVLEEAAEKLEKQHHWITNVAAANVVRALKGAKE